jgi:hypothetical protein
MTSGMPFCSATCDCGGLAGIESADQELRTVIDQLFRALARDIDVGFGIAVHDRKFRQAQ